MKKLSVVFTFLILFTNSVFAVPNYGKDGQVDTIYNLADVPNVVTVSNTENKIKDIAEQQKETEQKNERPSVWDAHIRLISEKLFDKYVGKLVDKL